MVELILRLGVGVILGEGLVNILQKHHLHHLSKSLKVPTLSKSFLFFYPRALGTIVKATSRLAVQTHRLAPIQNHRAAAADQRRSPEAVAPDLLCDANILPISHFSISTDEFWAQLQRIASID